MIDTQIITLERLELVMKELGSKKKHDIIPTYMIITKGSSEGK